MFYYRIYTSTPYCGTDDEEYYKFEERPTETELNDLVAVCTIINAESYEYLVTGWNDDEYEDEADRQEALDNYYADCYGSWEEISEEEFEENT